MTKVRILGYNVRESDYTDSLKYASANAYPN